MNLVRVDKEKLLSFTLNRDYETHVLIYESYEKFKYQFTHDKLYLAFRVLKTNTTIKAHIIINGQQDIKPLTFTLTPQDVDENYAIG